MMSQPLRALYSPFQRKNPKFFLEFSVIWSSNEGKHPPRAAERGQGTTRVTAFSIAVGAARTNRQEPMPWNMGEGGEEVYLRENGKCKCLALAPGEH